jgi:hypothetical protein
MNWNLNNCVKLTKRIRHHSIVSPIEGTTDKQNSLNENIKKQGKHIHRENFDSIFMKEF